MGAPTPPSPGLNDRVRNLRPSGIRVIADLSAQRLRAGKPVYPFHVGEPDFDTPDHIKRAATTALERGETHYPPTAGLAELRAGVVHDLRRRYGFEASEQGVVITVGACEALTLALWTCLEPGTNVVVTTPCWPNYLQTPELLGARVKEVPLTPEEAYVTDVERVASATDASTRAILVNTPSNPTGATLGREEIEGLLAHCREQRIWLIVDEIYHDIVYRPGWNSVLDIASPDDPVLYVNGFSKSYAMTGWRLGYVVAPAAVARHMVWLHQALVTSVTSFAQYGALAALDGGPAVVAAMRSRYAVRRQRVLEALDELGLVVTPPNGAFYVFPQVPAGWDDGDAFAKDVLTRQGVAVVPGSVFGTSHARSFRLCFACADDLLEEGLRALGEAIEATAAARR